MTARTHKFKVEQTINHSIVFSSGSAGVFEIASPRPAGRRNAIVAHRKPERITLLRRAISPHSRLEFCRDEEWAGCGEQRRKEATMFKILELKNADSASPAEVGYGYNTREQALAAVKKHLATFKISGRNPEGDYWWVRDSEGLRKVWISSAD